MPLEQNGVSSLVSTAEGNREPVPDALGAAALPCFHQDRFTQLETLVISPRPCRSPVPLTSCAFPFATFVKLLVSVRDAMWSKDGRKARRATCSLPDLSCSLRASLTVQPGQQIREGPQFTTRSRGASLGGSRRTALRSSPKR